MTAPMHFDEAILNSIIRATNDHAESLNVINNRVQTLRFGHEQANRSQSGRAMSERIDQWTVEFKPIIDSLEELNNRARSMGGSLRDGEGLTTLVAQSHR